MQPIRDLMEDFVARYGRLPTEVDPDYLEMLRMSKYRIVEIPDFKPHKCGNCGSSKQDGRKYVDFGLEIDWYGTLYLCGLCLHDVAQHMGLFEALADRVDNAECDLNEARQLLETGGELHERVTKTLKEFEDFYIRVFPDGVDRNSNSTPDIVPEPETPNGSGTIEVQSGAVKPTPESRPKNVRRLADLLTESGE